MQNNTFSTNSLNLASFLLSRQVKFLSVGQESPGKFYFEFEDAALCESLELEFMNMAETSAKTLLDCRETLLRKMKNQRSDYGNAA